MSGGHSTSTLENQSLGRFKYSIPIPQTSSHAISIIYNVDLTKFDPSHYKSGQSLLHMNNVILTSSTIDAEAFVQLNKLKLADLNKYQDLLDPKRIFVISQINPSSLPKSNLGSKKDIKPNNLQQDNVSIQTSSICCSCKRPLPEDFQSINKHLFDCLVKRGSYCLGSEESKKEENKMIKHKRKRNKVFKGNFNIILVVTDVLSFCSETDDIANKEEHFKEEFSESSSQSMKKLVEHQTKTSNSQIVTHSLSHNFNQKMTPKPKRKPRLQKDEVKVCPYCLYFSTKNEKKFNVHIAGCYEKQSKDNYSQQCYSKRRVTFKTYFYEPLDYEVKRFLY